MEVSCLRLMKAEIEDWLKASLSVHSGFKPSKLCEGSALPRY